MRRDYSLGELLTLQRRLVKVEPEQEYAEIGVRSFGKGIFHKLPRPGLEVGDKELYLVKEGDFILQITFAWEGAVGLASSVEDNMYCSVRFPTFRVNHELCEPQYLLYYFRTKNGLRQLGNISPGSAGRNRVLSVKRVPEIIVPLPPLDEQRRIIAHIEALAARIAEACGLRQQAVEEAEAFTLEAPAEVFKSVALSSYTIPIGQIFKFRYDLIHPTDGESGPLRFIGLQHIESHTGKRIGEDSLLAEDLKGRKFRFSPGEIVYGYLRPYLNKVWIADCDGFCSVDQYVLQPKSNMVDTQYLAHYMRSKSFLKRAIELTHNLQLPRLRSGLLEGIPIPVPSIDEQNRIIVYLDDLHARVDALKRLQAETAAELDALLPAVLDRAFRGELST